MKTSEVLNKAADLIEERGWGQGSGAWGCNIETQSADAQGALCLEGAIGAAMGRVVNIGGPDGIWPEALNACPAASAVRDYLGFRGSYLYEWNDDQSDAERVIATLRAAAVIEAARETPSAPTDVRVGTGVGARVGG